MRYEQDERTRDGMSRRQLLRGGVLAGSLAWSAPAIVSIAAPAFGQNRSHTGVVTPTPTASPTATPTATTTPTPNPTPTETPTPLPPCGRMTGGGTVAGNVRYGFELHCRPGVQSDNLTVSFVDPQGQQLTFHLDSVTATTCSDQPGVDPSPPDADFDTMEGTGVGHLTPQSAACTAPGSATISFKFVDAGEPSTNDMVHLFITCGNSILLNVGGSPTGGNIQAHDDPDC